MLRPQSAMPPSLVKKQQCPAEKLLREKKQLQNTEKSFNSHIDKLALANQDYFDHLAGKCICAICICGFHKCNAKQLKIDTQFNGPSTYKDHYGPKTSTRQLSKNLLDPQYWKSPQIKNPMDFNTTYRSTYTRPQTAVPTIHKGPSEVKGRLPMNSQSNYSDNFVDWPSQKTDLMKPLHNTGIIKDLPSNKETSYRKEFQPKDAKPSEIDKLMNQGKLSKFKYNLFINNLCNRSPISSDFPFLQQTTSGAAFQPFKAYKYNNLKYFTKVFVYTYNKKYNQPSLKFPAYANQYRTQYRDDYEDKGKKICPASLYVKGENMI